MPAFHRKYLSEFAPLEQTSIDLRTKLVYRLDQTYDMKGLTKSERRTIADLISDLAGELVAESDDPELKTIYNRYSESDFDSEAAAKFDDRTPRETKKGPLNNSLQRHENKRSRQSSAYRFARSTEN
ncbi:hypothetical protein AXG89_27780 (plasmid) [Burkholderia sp. PAMC 26561]|nr:hypothetical protein AXG89_24915 [Burkholderia sp. PAMC 26561]AME27688.1 hypothetical protein AXG89_27780 [Burkholderia sp. PAMC 26561]